MIEDFFDKAVRYIGERKSPAFLISIGAMDGVMFDEICGYTNLFGFKGLYVEPIPHLYDKLRNNIQTEGNLFENSAISNYNGELDMLTIDKEAIDSGKIHPCFYGMSSVYPPKNGLGSDEDKEVVKTHGRILKVPCITFDSLLEKHKIENFDILKMDAEGHDWVIMNTIDLNKYRPSVMRIEWINLTDIEKKAFSEKMKAHNYVFEVADSDVTAITKELFLILDSGQIPEPISIETKQEENLEEVSVENNSYKVEFVISSAFNEIEEIKNMFSTINSLRELKVDKIYIPEKLNFVEGVCKVEDFTIKVSEEGIFLSFEDDKETREPGAKYSFSKNFSKKEISKTIEIIEKCFDSSSFYNFSKVFMES